MESTVQLFNFLSLIFDSLWSLVGMGHVPGQYHPLLEQFFASSPCYPIQQDNLEILFRI